MLKAQKHVDLARFELGGKFISDKKKFFETEQDWNHFSNLVSFVKKRNLQNHGWQNHFLAAFGWSARAVNRGTWSVPKLVSRLADKFLQ